MKDFLIAPSILYADFARLGADVESALAAGADIFRRDGQSLRTQPHDWACRMQGIEGLWHYGAN